MGLSIGSPIPSNSRPYQPSIEYPGTVRAPSRSDFESS